jgi:phytoene dehydrogenase-like protein
LSRPFSTGALTALRKEKQQEAYSKNIIYDYVFVGCGMATLTAASLFAKAQKKVCILEAHDVPGGYAHTFEMNDFHFCAQVHYIWGCAPGQRIYEFLKKIGLEKEIVFNSYDPNSYDVMSLPDGKRVSIPYGFEKLIDHIEKSYPGQGVGARKFIEVIEKISKELAAFPSEGLSFWEYLTKGFRFLTLFRYRNKTVQDVFDECLVGKEAQSVLAGNSGDFMCPPNELSIFAYIGLFNGYNEGAYYPVKHFKHLTETLANFIESHADCHIFYETEVFSFLREGDEIQGVETKEGKRFFGKNVICNMDPQKAVKMIGEEFFSSMKESVSYQYSPSSFNIYLGVKDLDLRDFGFGNFNIWHIGQWDTNKMWEEMMRADYEEPLIFLSTPTLHSEFPGIAPSGCQILEIVTSANHEHFRALREKGEVHYQKAKRELANHLIEIVEKKYVPNLRSHIALKVVGSPLTNESFCLAPFGNCYGSHMTPENMGVKRLKADSPFKNFYFCNASSGYAGVFGAVYAGQELYMKLSSDRYYDPKMAPTREEAIAFARRHYSV